MRTALFVFIIAGIHFSKAPAQPAITLTRPAGGDTLIAGTMDSVTWVSTPQIDSVRIEIMTNGIWQIVVAGTPNPNIYRYVVPNAPSGRFRVSWKSDASVNDFTDPPFIIIPNSQPQFAVAPRQLDFGILPVPSCKLDSVKVRNIGNTPLMISEIRSTNPRFYATPTSATISAGESLWVRVNYCADFPAGAHTSSLVFSHNGIPSRDTVALVAYANTYNQLDWQIQTTGTTASLYAVRAVSDLVGWAGGTGGTVLRTINAGNRWTSVGGGAIGTADIYAIDAIDSNTALVSTSPSSTFIYRTTNGGSNWSQVFTQAGGFIDAIHMYDASNGIAIGDPVGGKWTILKTTNGGLTWARTATEPPQIGSEFGWNVGAAFADCNGWFLPTANWIYKTTDCGTTWVSITTPVQFMSLSFNDPQRGMAANKESTARSIDGGLTWILTTPLRMAQRSVIVRGIQNTQFYIAKDDVVYRTYNHGESSTVTFPGGIGTIWDMSFVAYFSHAYGWAVGTTGSIAYHHPVIDDVDEQAAVMPKHFALEQNYPNPFNPSTTIEYELPSPVFVTLAVYNLLGEEVRTLVNENQSAGRHSLQLTAEGLPSGMYFYRIQTATFVQSRKMILLR